MVSMMPTSVGGIERLSPIELSNATGTNSVVLKMKAESASASTPHHECFAATESGVDIAGRLGKQNRVALKGWPSNRTAPCDEPWVAFQEKARTAAGKSPYQEDMEETALSINPYIAIRETG